jgi:hypothetical protein
MKNTKSLKSIVEEEVMAIMIAESVLNEFFGDEEGEAQPAAAPQAEPSRVSPDTEKELMGSGNLKTAKQISIQGDEGSFKGRILKVQENPNAVEISFMTPWKEIEKILLSFDEVQELVTNKFVQTVSGKVQIA